MTTPVPSYQLTVQSAGSGKGSVSSSPVGINCGTTCSAMFAAGTTVELTASSSTGSAFAGWSGGCNGTGSCTVTLGANTTVTVTFNPTTTPTVQLSIQTAGTGMGTVASSPAGISCPSTCNATFSSGASVTLAATPGAGSTFTGWSGACTGTGTCALTLSADTTATATFSASSGVGSLSSINHIIYLAQENRSFDQYFGALRQYWANNGYPDQSFDGLPQFNPTSGASPLQGPAPSIPGCDPSSPPLPIASGTRAIPKLLTIS